MRSRNVKRVWRRKERGAPARERGTVLLMVIGVLALLAIIAVVYASLGQSDRRTSAALVRSVQIEDVSGQIADYLAGIIGQDVTEPIDEYYTGTESSGLARRFHATWTIPGIAFDDEVKSRPTNTNEKRYRPVGGGRQPWLAPSEPTFIRFNGAPNWTNNERQFLDFRDWLSISNVVPNGQFVNLANLRNNFYAEPGTGLDASGRPQLSRGLTLYGPNGLPYRSGAAQKVDASPADPNIPWHWTALQRHAARPIALSNFYAPGAPGPAEDEYYPNQWADADGDGIGDSRWFLLADLVGAPSDQPNGWTRPGVAQQDRARYFAAVRIVDLAGMINISTASDITSIESAPGPLVRNAAADPEPADYPFGLTPADTDLPRLLALQDAYQRYDVGYDGLQQAFGMANLHANYSQYTNDAPDRIATQVGHAAYAMLQWSMGSHRRTGPLSDGRLPNGQIPAFDADAADSLATYENTTGMQRLQFFNAARQDPTLVGYSAQAFITNPSNSNQTISSVRTSSPFGMNELLELHAFYGVNDPRERSRLEAVLDGRRTTGSLIRPSYGPLRSSRDLDVERERRGDNRGDGQQDDDSLTQQHVDIRHVITTVAATRPFTSLGKPWESNPSRFAADEISEKELKVDLTPYLYSENQISNDALKRLYNHVCDAIMPYRYRGSNTPGPHFFDTTAPRNRALHYAGSAEFTMRSAAHWLVNLIDSVDDDDSTDAQVRGPTCITLRTATGGALNQQSLQYPWPQITLSQEAEHIELPNARMVESARINIYGIEAQPFLVEAASYAFWTDMSPHRNGQFPLLPNQRLPDDEPNPPPNDPPPPVTIDGDVEYENADFLGEIIAFQVTNPFERELVLTRPGSAGPEFIYYVEYAGRYFPLARMNEADPSQFVNEEIKLQPGETRVFFATSPRSEFRFSERFRVANGSILAPNPPVPGNFLQSWVDRQFRLSTEVGPTREPIHTTMFDPTTFETIAPGDTLGGGDPERGLMDLHGEDIDATTNQRRVVNLWRILRVENSTYDPTGRPNMTHNDLLCDRLHDPAPGGTATLYQRLWIGNQEIDGSRAGPDNVPPPAAGDPMDNTGLTVTLWGAIRRPTNPTIPGGDPLDPEANAPRGAMPPWCIEARLDQEYGWFPASQGVPGAPGGVTGSRRSLNFAEDGPGSFDARDFDNGTDSLYMNMGDFIADQAQGDGGVRVNNEIRKKAEDKRGNPIPLSQSRKDATTYRSFNEQAIRIALGGRDVDGQRWNAGLYKRIGDILLPLAIGPYYDPSLPAHPQNPDDIRRMALSEALALAMDYYTPSRTGGNRPLYYRAGHIDPTINNPTLDNPAKPKLDRGHFVIDDFVLFNDVNQNGVFDPSAANAKEAPLGLGIPVALNLLDKFRLDDAGNRTKGEIGKVNINTATLTALSVLPMLAPDPLCEWITTDFPNSSNPVREGFYDPSTQHADRAATLLAYRDKLDIRTRPLFSGPNFSNRVGNSTLEISFRDTVNQLRNPWMFDGRRTRAQIPGLREEPGFRSVGEVLAARLRAIPGGAAPDSAFGIRYLSNSMDWHGLDQESFRGQRGIEPVNVARLNALGELVEDHDTVKDDYGEKLAIANAVLSSITTRSDTFCVYFLLHGYLPADVENLGANDPMIPSIARRYMMIVDRTNVIKRGDKPRILMFREVPL